MEGFLKIIWTDVQAKPQWFINTCIYDQPSACIAAVKESKRFNHRLHFQFQRQLSHSKSRSKATSNWLSSKNSKTKIPQTHFPIRLAISNNFSRHSQLRHSSFHQSCKNHARRSVGSRRRLFCGRAYFSLSLSHEYVTSRERLSREEYFACGR